MGIPLYSGRGTTVNGLKTFDRTIFVLAPLLLVTVLLLVAHLIGPFIG